MKEYLDWITQGNANHQHVFLMREGQGSPRIYFNIDEFKIKNLSENEATKGCYIGLNPGKESGFPHQVDDIKCRTNLLLDVDRIANPITEKQNPASDEEHNIVLNKIPIIKDWLKSKLLPDPLIIDSGNGVGFILPLDNFKNDDNCSQAIEQFYELFEKETNIHPDFLTHPNLITRIPETINRRGQSTPERPWRSCKLLEIPERKPITWTNFLSIIGPINVPEKKIKTNNSNFCDGINKDLETFTKYLTEKLNEKGIEIKSSYHRFDSYRFNLSKCPVSGIDSTGHSDMTVFYFDDKSLGYENRHDHAKAEDGYGWNRFRHAIDENFEDALKFDEIPISEEEKREELKEKEKIEKQKQNKESVIKELDEKTKHYLNFYKQKNKTKINLEGFSPEFIKILSGVNKFTKKPNIGFCMAVCQLGALFGNNVTFDVDMTYRCDIRCVDIANSGSGKTPALTNYVKEMNKQGFTRTESLGTITVEALIANPRFAYQIAKKSSKKKDIAEQNGQRTDYYQNLEKTRIAATKEKGIFFYSDDSMSFLETVSRFNSGDSNGKNLSIMCRIFDDNEPGEYTTRGDGTWWLADLPRNFFMNCSETYGDFQLDTKAQQTGFVFRILPIDSNVVELNYDFENYDLSLLKKIHDLFLNNIEIKVKDLEWSEDEKKIQENVWSKEPIDIWNYNYETAEIMVSKIAIIAKKIAVMNSVCDWIKNINIEDYKTKTGDPTKIIELEAFNYYSSAFELCWKLVVNSLMAAFNRHPEKKNSDKLLKRISNLTNHHKIAGEKEKIEIRKLMTKSQLINAVAFDNSGQNRSKSQLFDEISKNLISSGMIDSWKPYENENDKRINKMECWFSL